jgi:pyruvate dehydrogenase E1 component alpha subunit
MTAQDLIAFETRIRDHFAAGALPCLIHLSGGNEEQLLDIFSRIRPQDWVFSTHRNHYHALLKGIPADHLESEILAGRSMFIYSRDHNFLTSSILAGTCAIAAGVAWAIKFPRNKDQVTSPENLDTCSLALGPSSPPHVYCFLGDGAEEEGHYYEAALFAEANDLPITFIIEDNARQVDTPKSARRGHAENPTAPWYKATITHAPLDMFNCVKRYHYTPTYPHGGAGLPPGSVTFAPAAIARLKSAQN